MNKIWWKEAVIYQIYPRSFMDSNGDGIGDLVGIIEKLDYIKYLGVDAIWLSPINRSPNCDNGYDISDYREIMHAFGTMGDFDRLLKEIHKRGLKILIDLVVNHTSDEHRWFREARKTRDNPYRDYYYFRKGKGGSNKTPNNWKSWFGGSAWEYDSLTEEYYLHLFSKNQPDLNWDNKKVRNEIYDIMKFWLNKGIDGFRMDAIDFISKVKGLPESKNINDEHTGKEFYLNETKIHKYLNEMNREVLSRYNIMTAGEVLGVDPEEARKYIESDREELNMLLTWEHMHVDYGKKGTWDIKNWSLVDLKKILTKWQGTLDKKGWNSQYLSNHDQPRQVSRFGNDKKYRIESAKMLATMIHTLKGTPFIYQGEEIGMTNYVFNDINEYDDIFAVSMYKESIRRGEDKERLMKVINYRSRDNARTPMQWNSSSNAGFSREAPWLKVNPNYGSINVEESIKDKNSIFNYYRKLIELRKKNNILIYGKYEIILENNENIYAYLRSSGNEKLLIILNFSEDSHLFELPGNIRFAHNELLISNYDIDCDKINELFLKPYEARVYRLR